MSKFSSILAPRSALADLLQGRRIADSAVLVSDRDGIGIATILARKRSRAALVDRFREHYRLSPPRGPHRFCSGHLALAATGPDAWLATVERGGNAAIEALRATLGDVASVCDQSDAYAVLRLSGPRARDTLAQLLPIDLHPRAFGVGDVAVTVAGHIGVTLWRIEDHAHGAPSFEILVCRSMAASFWRVLTESAAPFGPVGAHSESILAHDHERVQARWEADVVREVEGGS